MPHQQPGGLSLPLALAPQPPSRALSSSTISSLLLLHPFPMDVSFSSKSQTLIYALSLSSSHFHLPISVRREFLGCGGQLRPPGLRSRRRCRKLGFQFQSPRCLFQDSMYSDSILVVAVAFATFTALRVFYLNHTRRRREAPEGIDLIKQEAVESQFLGSESLYAEPLMKERENTVERTRENKCSEKTCISDIKDAQLFKFETNILTCEGTYKISQQPGNECLASVPAETVPAETATAKTTAAIGLSQSYMIVHEVGTIEQDYFAADLPDLLPRDREDIVAVSDMPRLIVEPTHSGSTDPISIAVTDEDYKPEHEIAEKDELLVSSCNVLPKQFVRQVSVLNEEKQPEVHSRSHFKSLSTKPPHLSIHENSRAYFRLRPALNGPDISAKGVPIACFKESSVCKQKDLVKAHDFTRDSGRYLMYQNDERNISVFPQPNRMIVKDANDPSAHLRTYNRLLKNSRLKDCVDLLESMETKGLLDMDKIYHTIFLKACKSQKAVKEAFRFTRLIKKPTLSTFNMLLSVCASSQDFEGAFRVMQLVKEAGLKPDCKLYTTLISTCAKSGKVDAMFEVFHEMVNAGVEPNVNTYGALIDGCARAGQVAKAFGAYGIMRSKKVQPDRVVFNALISACGQSGAVDRAFDVLAEMMAEPQPIEPDHVTVGALMKTCTQAGQVDRTHEVYKMLHQYNIKGTPDVYTIAVNSCSQTGDLEFACSIYDDMTKNGVLPDEMFLSTLLDVAGHAGKAEAAFEILQDARSKGIRVGNVSYSSLMGACCNAKDWQKALEVYEDIKAIKLRPTVSTLNALVTSLCDGDQLMKSVQVLDEMKEAGVCPNITTYSILIVACEKKCEGELGFKLFSQAKKDGILPNLIMCRCLTGLCLQSFQKEYSLGEPIVSFNSGKPQIDSKWASLAIMVYRETIAAGVIPTIEVFSQVLGCLQFPHDTSLRQRFVENLGVSFDASRCSNLCSFLDGFGEYDPRSFSILEEAASLGVVPRVSFKENPIIVDARKLCIHIVEVYLLTILKGLKHRLAAGAKLPNITVLLPTEKTRFESDKGEMTIKLAGRVGQTVGSLLRRLGLPYLGRESYGKIRINGLSLRRWCKPKITNSSFDEKAVELTTSPTVLARGITDQQRNIRSSNNLSLEQQGLLSHCDMKERFTVLFHAD